MTSSNSPIDDDFPSSHSAVKSSIIRRTSRASLQSRTNRRLTLSSFDRDRDLDRADSDSPSDTSLNRPTRQSTRVKWRDSPSGAFDNEESSQAIGLQPLMEQTGDAGDTEVEGIDLISRVSAANGGTAANAMPLYGGISYFQGAAPNLTAGLLDGDSVDIRVLITGMHNVGKTCLAESLSTADKWHDDPARELLRQPRRFPGQPYHTAVVTPRTCCYVTFFDSPMLTSWPTDQLAEFDSFKFPLISTAHAIILTFDLTFPESFDYVKRVKAAILAAAEQHSLIHCPPLFVVGNKADAPRSKSLPRKEDIESLVTKMWAREMETTSCESLHYCEVSSSTGWKVHDLLSTLVLNHLEQHMSLAESASAAYQRQRQRAMRKTAKKLSRPRRDRRRQSITPLFNCLTQ